MQTFQKLLFSVFFLVFTSSVCGQLIQPILYNRGFDNLIPKYIIPAHDSGLIVNGSHNESEFVMKIDSAYKPLWVRQIFKRPTDHYFYSECLTEFTDSTYMMVSPYRPADSLYNFLSIAEIAEDGEVFSKRLVDFGEKVVPFKQIIRNDGESLVMMKGNSNTLVQLDSLGYPNWARSYENSQNNVTFLRMEEQSDSTFFTIGSTGNNFFLSSMKNDGEILWSKRYALFIDNDATGFDIYKTDSVIHILLVNWEGSYLLRVDEIGNFIGGFKTEFARDEYNFYNKTGFMSVDSSGYIFYAGNSILKVDQDDQVVENKGNYVALKGFHQRDSSFYMLIKNGFIPVQKAISKGNEMGMYTGGSLSKLFTTEADCMDDGYYGYSNVLQLETDTFMMTIVEKDFEIIDSVSLINGLGMDMQFGCPDAPNAVGETEDFKINIYPNPTTGMFFIDAEKNIKEVKVYNSFGQKITQLNDNNKTSLQIHTDQWNTGIYYTTINIEGQLITKKILVSER